MLSLDVNWVELLKIDGDPFEKRGIAVGLGERFPRYAEFWGVYVRPNRDPDDASKLRPGLPPKEEGVYNNHYGVFYQLTTALEQAAQIDNPILDIADPIYHLGVAVDLIKMTFISVAHAKGLVPQELEEIEFLERMKKYWKQDYQKAFKGFMRKKFRQPVGLTFHDTNSLFKQYVVTTSAFRAAVQEVQEYRNTLIHNLPPLKRVIDGKIHIPKPKSLHQYKDALWSSGRYEGKDEDYAPASEVVQGLANNLIDNANDLWEVLLGWMREIFPDGENIAFSQILENKRGESGQWLPEWGFGVAHASGMVDISPGQAFPKNDMIDFSSLESRPSIWYLGADTPALRDDSPESDDHLKSDDDKFIPPSAEA